MKARFLLVIVIIITTTLAACSTGIPGNPTAKDILKSNPDADILQYDGLIYENREDHEFLPALEDLVKYEEIGEIKETKDSYWGFNDFSASTLPVGTKVFSTEDEDFHYLLIIELDGEEIIYTVLLEG